jgi:hypothetical protein
MWAADVLRERRYASRAAAAASMLDVKPFQLTEHTDFAPAPMSTTFGW